MPEVVAPFCPELVTESPEAGAIAQRLLELLDGRIPLPARPTCQEYVQRNFDWQNIAQRVRKVLLA
jgi:glycosyltransferase involved in cell wall biosynthesis